MSAPSRAPSVAPVAVASIASFVAIGLPEASLGVALPAIRSDFDVSLTAVGLLLPMVTLGYLAAALGQGPLHGRVGTGARLVAGAASGCAGALAFVVAPFFGLLAVGSVLIGVCSGTFDAGLSAFVATRLHHRVIAFMHGGFGIGATLGPLVVTAALAAGGGWRAVYGVLATLDAVLVVLWLRMRGTLAAMPELPSEPDVVAFEGDIAELPGTGAAATPAPTGHGSVPLQLLMFLLYVALEATIGLLLATLLTSRGITAATAGLLTTSYWAALTAGRFAVGGLGRRVAPAQFITGAAAVTLLGVALLEVGGSSGIVLVAPVVLGFGLAPVFPSLVALTPARVGPARTPTVIGYQLAAAGLGLAVVPPTVAAVADRLGAAAIGPALVALAVVFVAVLLGGGAVVRDLWPLYRERPGARATRPSVQ